MSAVHHDIVIVRAQVAVALRQRKFVGTIALVGDGPDLSHERRPLANFSLAGTESFEPIVMRHAGLGVERAVTMATGRLAVAVDTDAHRLTLKGGGTSEYNTLIRVTDVMPRRLNCISHDQARVHVVRLRADVDRMRAPNRRRLGICRASRTGHGRDCRRSRAAGRRRVPA